MKFNTKHNGMYVAIEYDEYDAADQDGAVLNFEITYQGHIVTQLLSDHEAMFTAMCEAHLKAHCEAERFNDQMDRAADMVHA
jgi:hypothetical protein